MTGGPPRTFFGPFSDPAMLKHIREFGLRNFNFKIVWDRPESFRNHVESSGIIEYAKTMRPTYCRLGFTSNSTHAGSTGAESARSISIRHILKHLILNSTTWHASRQFSCEWHKEYDCYTHGKCKLRHRQASSPIPREILHPWVNYSL